MERDRIANCERGKDLAYHGCEGGGHVALPAVPMLWEVRGRVIQDVGREEVRHLVRSADVEELEDSLIAVEAVDEGLSRADGVGHHFHEEVVGVALVADGSAQDAKAMNLLVRLDLAGHFVFDTRVRGNGRLEFHPKHLAADFVRSKKPLNDTFARGRRHDLHFFRVQNCAVLFALLVEERHETLDLR